MFEELEKTVRDGCNAAYKRGLSDGFAHGFVHGKNTGSTDNLELEIVEAIKQKEDNSLKEKIIIIQKKLRNL